MMHVCWQTLGCETTRSTVPLASVVTIQYFTTPTGESLSSTSG
jgi:hypothetical protein